MAIVRLLFFTGLSLAPFFSFSQLAPLTVIGPEPLFENVTYMRIAPPFNVFDFNDCSNYVSYINNTQCNDTTVSIPSNSTYFRQLNLVGLPIIFECPLTTQFTATLNRIQSDCQTQLAFLESLEPLLILHEIANQDSISQNTLINQANTTANSAQQTATAAQNSANTALSTANNAQLTANQALSNSSANTGQIAQNRASIQSNSSQIALNTSRIASNTTLGNQSLSNSQINTGRITSNTASISSLTDNTETNSGRITNAFSAISNLNNVTQSNATGISTNSGRITNSFSAIGNLNTRANQFDTDIQNNSQSISSFSTSIDSNRSRSINNSNRITTSFSAIGGLGTRTTQAEAAIQNTNQTLSQLDFTFNEKTGELEQRLLSVDDYIVQSSQTDQQQTSILNNVLDSINTNASTISTLSSDVTANANSSFQNSESINSNLSSINSLEPRITAAENYLISNNNGIDANFNRIQTNITSLNNVNTRFNTLDQTIIGVNRGQDANYNRIQTNLSSINLLNDQQITNQQRLSLAENYLVSNNNGIDANFNRIQNNLASISTLQSNSSNQLLALNDISLATNNNTASIEAAYPAAFQALNKSNQLELIYNQQTGQFQQRFQVIDDYIFDTSILINQIDESIQTTNQNQTDQYTDLDTDISRVGNDVLANQTSLTTLQNSVDTLKADFNNIQFPELNTQPVTDSIGQLNTDLSGSLLSIQTSIEAIPQANNSVTVTVDNSGIENRLDEISTLLTSTTQPSQPSSPDTQAELAMMETQLSTTITNIRSQMSDRFSIDLNTIQNCESSSVEAWSTTIDLGFCRYLPQLSNIPTIIIFLAYLYSFYILVGTKK